MFVNILVGTIFNQIKKEKKYNNKRMQTLLYSLFSKILANVYAAAFICLINKLATTKDSEKILKVRVNIKL